MIKLSYNTQLSLSFLLLPVGVIFPRLGLIITSLLLLMPIKLDRISFKLIKLIFAFGVGCLAFSFVRIDGNGDVYHYEQAFNYLKNDLLLTHSFEFSLYNFYYYSWYSLQLLVIKLFGDFRWVNFISLSLFAYASISIIELLNKFFDTNKYYRLLFLKILIFFSIVSVFSSYKSSVALVLVSYGVLMYIFQNKKLTSLFWCIIGVGFHPAAILLILCYFLSRYIYINTKMISLLLLIGLLAKPIFVSLLTIIPTIPFFTDKLLFYLNGEWANYRFHDRGEYIIVFHCITSIIFYILTYRIVNKKLMNVSISITVIRLIKLTGVYLSFILIFISFRTIMIRYVIGGLFLFFPLIYMIIISSKKLNYRTYIFWFTLFLISSDPRGFMLPFYNGISIGKGFPTNVFESIFNIFL